ncbi:hypothetical protein QBC44DRAFT_309291 [Cladorrhinum sp. PSN332]|nr:hypothetical protein QBC44DRAFT_309291 [Cladorrhinum sp. PSN332]
MGLQPSMTPKADYHYDYIKFSIPSARLVRSRQVTRRALSKSTWKWEKQRVGGPGDFRASPATFHQDRSLAGTSERRQSVEGPMSHPNPASAAHGAERSFLPPAHLTHPLPLVAHAQMLLQLRCCTVLQCKDQDRGRRLWDWTRRALSVIWPVPARRAVQKDGPIHQFLWAVADRSAINRFPPTRNVTSPSVGLDTNVPWMLLGRSWMHQCAAVFRFSPLLVCYIPFSGFQPGMRAKNVGNVNWWIDQPEPKSG